MLHNIWAEVTVNNSTLDKNEFWAIMHLLKWNWFELTKVKRDPGRLGEDERINEILCNAFAEAIWIAMHWKRRFYYVSLRMRRRVIKNDINISSCLFSDLRIRLQRRDSWFVRFLRSLPMRRCLKSWCSSTFYFISTFSFWMLIALIKHSWLC